jgi:hypothetical protein
VDYRSVREFVHAEKLSFKKAQWLANAIVLTRLGGAASGLSAKIVTLAGESYRHQKKARRVSDL